MSQRHDVYENPLPSDHYPLLVRDLMTPTPVTVEPTATVRDIAQVMRAHDIRAVPVVDIGDVLVGIVSEADLVCREGYPTVRSHTLAALLGHGEPHKHDWDQRAKGLTAEEIMSKDVVTCAPDEPVTVVTRRLLREDVRSLPVIDHGQLVGILSRHDMLTMFDRPDPEVRWRVDHLLTDPGWAPAGHHVEAEVLDGVVILTGTVRLATDARVLCALMEHVPGVVEVVDRTTTSA